MRNSKISFFALFLFAAAPPLIFTQSPAASVAAPRRAAVDATGFSGTDGCAKINAAIASLPPEGGIIDATGFTSPQVVSTTCVTTIGPDSGQSVEIDFSPSTRWVPAIASMSVVSVNPKTILKGLQIDASGLTGYSGNAIEFVQYNDADFDYTALEDTQITLPAGTGIGIYLSPSATGNGYTGVNIRGLRIRGGLVAIKMVSGPTYSQFVNSNNFSDFWVKNAVTCISLDGRAQVGTQWWLSAMAGNHFVNGACQVGDHTVNSIMLKNASDNSFANVTTWDGGGSMGDATSDFNYWTGFGSGLVEYWQGVDNNYEDSHLDSISPTGLHFIRSQGGINFVTPKVQFANGSSAVQLLPRSFEGNSALQVSADGMDNSFIGPSKIGADQFFQGGSPLQPTSPTTPTPPSVVAASYGSGTDTLQATANGWQVVSGGFNNLYVEGSGVDFQNGANLWKLQENPNGINVVRAGCCNSTYLDGNKITSQELDMNNGQGFTMLLSAASPSIASGFGRGAAISGANGPASFSIVVGHGNDGTGMIRLPPSKNAWNCWCNDLTQTTAWVFMCKQTRSSPNTAILQNFGSLGRPRPWGDHDTLTVSCFAR